MNQTVAKFFAGVFILLGILGFFGFAGGTMAMQPHTDFLRVFPVNLVHNVAHIVIGFWGLNAARTMEGATAYCKQAGVLYLLLGILGLIPAAVDMFASVMPLGGHNQLLHLGFGLILGFFGFLGGSRS